MQVTQNRTMTESEPRLQELRRHLVDKLPVGSNLVVRPSLVICSLLADIHFVIQAIFDSCHSASMLGMLGCWGNLSLIKSFVAIYRSPSHLVQQSLCPLDFEREAQVRFIIEWKR